MRRYVCKGQRVGVREGEREPAYEEEVELKKKKNIMVAFQGMCCLLMWGTFLFASLSHRVRRAFIYKSLTS